MTKPRIALVHDWLTGMRGGEKCLEPAARYWPTSRLYTLLHKRGSVSREIQQLVIRPSFLNALPGWRHYYRYLLPLMPLAAKWRIPQLTQLVLSFSHCVAKAAQPPPGVPHICYCFTPMRYAWHQREQYFRDTGLKAKLRDSLLSRLRDWDRATADRVTHFVAISRTIQARIKECYDRESIVIAPPVDTGFYTPSTVQRERFYLIVSALAPYKRFDLALEACGKLQRQLVVIGTGQEARRLQSLAHGQVKFLGWQSDDVIRDHYRRCAAVLFPAEEDFGIVPVEAQACGAPVIAFGRGGASETILDGITGKLFAEQTVESMIAGIEQYERIRDNLNPSAARTNAEPYGLARYERELFGYCETILRSASSTAAKAPAQS